MEQKNENQWDGKRPDPITQTKEGWYEKLLARVPADGKIRSTSSLQFCSCCSLRRS